MLHFRPFATVRPGCPRLLPLAVILAMVLVACGSRSASAAQISVMNIWARPMVVETGATPATPMSGGTASAGMPGTMAAGSATTGGGMAGMGVGGVTDALYMTIANTGGTADRLTGARAEIAQATELHQTIIQNGVSQMQPVPGVDIPAGGTVAFRPGSYHVMLIGLAHTLKLGDTFPVTLTFAKSGAIIVMVTVRDQ